MVNDIHSITLPEKKWLEDIPDLTIPPVLAQDVSWIDLSRNMIDGGNSCSHCFADTVPRKNGVSFV